MVHQTLQKYLDNNDWENALNYLDSLGTPLDEELLERKAWCYSRIENFQNAIEIYLYLLKKQPNNAKLTYALGYQYYAQKNYSTAVDYFETALNIYPEYLKVKYRVAYAYLQLSGNEMQWTKDIYWKAIKHLNDSHKIYAKYSDEQKEREKSTYADICALHGKTMLNSPKYIEKAIELLSFSLSLKYDDDVQYQLAKAYYLKKDYENALLALPESEKVSFYVLELKALILFDTKRYDESNRALFQLIKHRKKDYLYRRISKNFLYMANLDKALEFVLKAIAYDGRNYKNYLVCGLINKELKQYKTAINMLEKARLLKQGKFKCDDPEAIRLIEEINQITANNPMDEDSHTTYSEQYIGIICKYDNNRGFGFIKSKSTEKDYFFHIKSVLSKRIPSQGMMVKFEIAQSQKGEVATNIVYC